jgi:hypothetical protein
LEITCVFEITGVSGSPETALVRNRPAIAMADIPRSDAVEVRIVVSAARRHGRGSGAAAVGARPSRYRPAAADRAGLGGAGARVGLPGAAIVCDTPRCVTIPQQNRRRECRIVPLNRFGGKHTDNRNSARRLPSLFADKLDEGPQLRRQGDRNRRSRSDVAFGKGEGPFVLAQQCDECV